MELDIMFHCLCVYTHPSNNMVMRHMENRTHNKENTLHMTKHMLVKLGRRELQSWKEDLPFVLYGDSKANFITE